MVVNGNLLITRDKVWSGRGDLNARPPAPKPDEGELQKQLVFN